MSTLGWIRRRLFGLSYRSVSFDHLGIECDPAIKADLERVPTRFLDGYHIALECDSVAECAARLDREIEPEFQGFAYEGAGMLLTILDLMTPWKRNRTQEFLAGHGASHDYIICIGIGFALARIPWARWNVAKVALRYPPGLSALVLDGFGFHQGFFHFDRYIDCCEVPREVPAPLLRIFDAGVGRVMWFVKGASPERVRDAIAKFAPERQPDLWSGIGLASTYAGSAYKDLAQYADVLERLKKYAGPHLDQYKQGVVFAAETRRKANNPTVWTSRACEVVLGLPFAEGARIGNECWTGLVAELSSELAVAGARREEIAFSMHKTVSERVIARLRAAAGAALPAVAGGAR